jgi:hypothetical protein
VVEVIKITRGTHESLSKATKLIKETLTSQGQTAAANLVDKQAKKNWGKQTLCRTTFSMADCSGYKAPKTTSTATGSSTTSTAAATTSSTTSTSG